MLKPSTPVAPSTSAARLRLLAVVTLLLAAAASGVLLSPAAKSARVEGGGAKDEGLRALPRDEAAASYARLPLVFEANAGQTDESVRFVSRGVGYTLFLTRDEAVFALRDRTPKAEGGKRATPGAEQQLAPASYSVLRMRLEGAERAPEAAGLEEQPGKLNYFIGNDPGGWRTNVPVYAKVRYTNVYRGVDLVYYGNQRQLEYDFQVAPGADPRAIKLRFEGAERARVEGGGDLVLELAGGEVRMRKPFVYQTAPDGGRQEIECRYVVKGRNAASFEVGAYDRARALVIDPIVSYASYLGSPGGEFGYGVAVDSSGNAYVTGTTSSASFPVTGQTFVTDNFSAHAFVTKVNPAGTALVYSTTIGGGAADSGLGIAVDGSGSAYVAGRTASTNFPTTANAIRGTAGVLKSTNAGDNWAPSTAGMGNRTVTSLAIDPANNAVVYAGTLGGSGMYKSTDGGASWTGLSAGFGGPAAIVIDPQNPSVLYAANNGGSFAVMKSTNGGTSWSPVNTGLFGGFLYSLAIDPANTSTVYVGTSGGVYKTTNGGENWASSGTGFGEVFSLAIDPANTSTVYAAASFAGVFKTTNGGASWSPKKNGLPSSAVRSLVIDPTNTSTVYAATYGGGVYKTTDGGDNWGPVNTGLTNLEVNVIARDAGSPSTLYAGTAATGIFKTVNGGGNWTKVYGGLNQPNVVALVSGPASTVLAGVDLRVGSFNSETEAFVTKLAPAGDALVYSTLLGGSGSEEGSGIAVNSAGQAHVVGSTSSADFPLVNARQATFAAGITDAYVTKLDAAGGSIVYSTYLGGTGIDSARGVAVDAAGNAYVAGQTNSTNFPVTPGAFQTTNGNSNPSFGDGDAFAAKLDPEGSSLLYSTYLGGAGNEIGHGVAVDSAGHAYVAGQTSSNNFPVLNAAQPKYMSGSFLGDAFATKLNPSGTGLVYSTYIGGTGSDVARAIAVAPDGAAVVAGGTESIDFNVTPDTLLNNSRVFRSTDGGATWDNRNTGLSGSLNQVVVDPQTPTKVYALTSSGLFRSTDEGRTWAPHGSGLGCCLQRLAIDPQNTSLMYVTVLSAPGVYKSTDGGATWTPGNGNLSFNFAKPVAADPTTSGTVYLGDFGVYKTTNGGTTWSPASAGIPGGTQINSITIDPTNPSVLYATGGSFARIYKSTNGGGSWAPADTTLPPGAQVFEAVVVPTNPVNVFAVTTSGLYKSAGGADNWAQSFNSNSTSDLVYDPQNVNTLYLSLSQPAPGSGAFVYKSTDGGANWLPTSGPPFRIHQLAVSTASVLFAFTDTVGGGGFDAFVTKLSAAGSSFVYSTYLGGHGGSNNASDQAYAVAADSAGNAYVAGWTSAGDFPATPDSYQAVNRGGDEAFVAKIIESFVIGGTVTSGATPQAGVRVVLTGDELRAATTGADGTYSFVNLRPGGNYTVSASKTGFTYTPPSQTFNNLSASQTANFSATASAANFHTVSGRVAEASGAAVPGATVRLTGSQIDFATTDADGNYSFSVPAGGDYTLTPAAPGFLFTPPAQTLNALAGNAVADFTAVRQDLVVTNTNNHGAGSLRQAVTDANAIPGRDRIVFNIPGPGVKTITLLAALPDLTGPVEIDATTQPGYAGAPVVEVEGPGQNSSTAHGLRLTGGNSVVRGLAIYRFTSGGGIALAGDNNVVEGCYLGVNAAGLARPNSTGLFVIGSNNRVGGTSAAARNVLSGNTFNGVYIAGANNLFKGNFVGTNPAGTSAVMNGGRGVEITGSPDSAQTANNVVGGTEDGARNVISGNGNNGIQTTASGTVIQGNFIGTDVTGTVALGNGTGIYLQGRNTIIGGSVPAARNVISGQGAGINVSTFGNDPQNVIQGNYIGIDAGGATALGNFVGIEVNGQNASIGGALVGEGNVISGNSTVGIHCRLGSGAVIRGNLIGTDASGNLPVGNGIGVSVTSPNNQIGGAAPGAGNVISGNRVGVSLEAPGAVVMGNFIGTNPAATAANPNTEVGVRAVFGGVNSRIGGDEAGAGNLIAFNFRGVGVDTSSAVNNLIRGNSIFSNAQLGIDLDEDGVVQLNDQLDEDAGPNKLQNFPVLTSVSAAGGSTHVEGRLDSAANTVFRVDFYSNAACDGQGYGEGARPFGSTTVTTDGAGTAAISVNLAGTVAAGRVLTATATDPANNTSEFSPCDSSAATGSVGFTDSNLNVLEDIGSLPLRVVRTGGSRGALTVNYSTGGGTATAGTDYTAVSGQLTFAEGETEKLISLPVADDGVTEAPEVVYLNLSGTPELEQLGPHARLAVRILDSSTPLTVAPLSPPAGGHAFPEGDAGTRNHAIPVLLSAATGRTVTVSYRTFNNSAVAGSDYVPVGGTLTFAPGTYRHEVQLPIIGDTLDEFGEIFTFELFDASNAGILLPRVEIGIVDDDAPPTISVTDVAAVEGGKAVFTIRLSQPSGKTASVTYTTADGTAAAGEDYTATAGAVTFNAGQTLKTVEVTLLGDAAAEADETFALNVASTNLTRATVADGQGVGTIIDQGSTAASLAQFSAASYSVNEADGQVQITVTRTGNTAQAASVDYSTVSGSASERSDFTASLGTLRFAAGETSKTFNVLVTDDRYLESAETLDLVLSNPSGVSLGAPSVVALTINSEDAADGASPVGDAAFDTAFFVRQHYHDFLNRQPDAEGLAFWVNEIEQCGSDALCREVKRINVSAAFFLSIEFQETGYLAYRTYKAAFGDATSPYVTGTVPVIRLREFLRDSQRIGQNVVVGAPDWEQLLEANKRSYMTEFVSRQRFTDAFPLSMSAAEFVDKLNQNAGGVLTQEERDQLVAQLAGSPDQTQGRAAVLRAVAEDADLRAAEKNRAFVLMQYYGYLRRNPDDPQDTDFRGWKFWLDKLNQFNGNFIEAEMVKAFITSDEYRKRFGR